MSRNFFASRVHVMYRHYDKEKQCETQWRFSRVMRPFGVLLTHELWAQNCVSGTTNVAFLYNLNWEIGCCVVCSAGIVLGYIDLAGGVASFWSALGASLGEGWVPLGRALAKQ